MTYRGFSVSELCVGTGVPVGERLDARKEVAKVAGVVCSAVCEVRRESV